MKQLIAFSVTLFSIFACDGFSSSQEISDVLPDDSAQLRIAVMPTLDCLPVFVADERGYFEREGIDVSLFPYQAQMDCDTAIERGRVNALVTDLVRAERMAANGLVLQYVTSTEASWQLLTASHARIRQLKQLDDKMLAMTRFSATHLLSDKAVDSARLQHERVFRIQVNDLGVRMSMLEAGIMDALLMPEPWATAARNDKAVMLFDTRDMDYRLGVVAFKDRAATAKQVTAFRKAYDMACDTINALGLHAFDALIMKRCGVSQRTVDSIPDLQFTHAATPRQKDITMATEWLKKQRKNVEESSLQ